MTEPTYVMMTDSSSGESWKSVVFRAAAAAVLTYATREVVKAAAPHVQRGVTTLIEKFSKQEVTTV